ncbi:hypothetical protein ACLOCO_14390 [Lactiplantibacillus plantarum]|jgi:hypothetical protein|uniref:YxeA family protein n=2 Tax=Lactobacillaceae TaxID=33958 RepID=A0AAU7NNQ3_PEDPE|nr:MULTISPECIES: hypothetical protein [Lactobacillaceae]TYA17238.1 hypothetical protein FXE14_15415 [Lactobacillus sp. LSI2-1]AYM04162.1 hypothetical protein D8911_14160 [Levilactobacillus brevis]KZU69537.1 hypothetical protein Nizo2814_0642 [Lactiplantibacillus plantarum]MBO2720051.1 hypothetical protein [Lactiplantibacillus plantarum]MBU7498382.1 hypothetical protein [Lactiplantibacillus pentosus]
MSNKKITIASIVLVFLAVLLGIAFIFGHKTTAEKLQAQEWILTSQEESNTVNFKKDNTMILGKEPMTENFKYSIKKQGNVEYLKLTHHEDLGSDGKYYFKIKKTDSGYSLILDRGKTNQPAKNAMYGMTDKNNLVSK